MGDEIGFVISRTSTMRTMVGGFQNCLLTESTPSLRAKRSNPESQRKSGLLRRFAPRNDELLGFIPKIRLDRTLNLQRQRIAVAILGVAGGHAHPAFADAILLDVGFLDALEANADVAREHIGV